MLSARAYSFRQKARLAISLSWIGGYVNTISLITCGRMISHVTGSLTSLVHSALDGSMPQTMYFVTIVGVFFAGAATASAITEVRLRRGGSSRFVLPILIEALALVGVAICANLYHQGTGASMTGIYLVSGFASFALGIQNATITRISDSVVRTTHLTGIVTDLGIESVQYAFWWKDRMRGDLARRAGRVLRISTRDPRFLRLALLGSILGSFLVGVAAATVVHTRWPTEAMLPPVLFLLAIVAVNHFQPIVDVAEVDVLSDKELAALGISRPDLPPEITLFRPSGVSQPGGLRRADFGAFQVNLDPGCRVAIVAVDSGVDLSGNAAEALARTAEALADEGRRLVVSGVSRVQFQHLESACVIDRIGMENICPDLEFAVSHAIMSLDACPVPGARVSS